MQLICDNDLGPEMSPVLMPIFVNMAKSYPQALYYPFMVSSYQFDDDQKERTQELRSALTGPETAYGLMNDRQRCCTKWCIV